MNYFGGLMKKYNIVESNFDFDLCQQKAQQNIEDNDMLYDIFHEFSYMECYWNMLNYPKTYVYKMIEGDLIWKLDALNDLCKNYMFDYLESKNKNGKGYVYYYTKIHEKLLKINSILYKIELLKHLLN